MRGANTNAKFDCTPSQNSAEIVTYHDEREERKARASKCEGRIRGSRRAKLSTDFQVPRDDGEKNYSLRRVTIGSVRMARRAGM